MSCAPTSTSRTTPPPCSRGSPPEHRAGRHARSDPRGGRRAAARERLASHAGERRGLRRTHRCGREAGERPGKEEGRGKHLAVQVRDCTGCLVMPGLIQAHIHLCQTLFRGLADELRLEQWLSRRIWPLEAAHTAETVYWAAMLGAAELLLGGPTGLLGLDTGPPPGAA